MGPGFGYAFEGIARLLSAAFIVLLVLAPLALWKLIDIAIWLFHHVSITP